MVEIIHGDCLEILKTLPDNSIEAIVTDPPAGIAFMGKHWDKDKGGRDHWIAWMSDVARECLRVIKPGGHALVWAIPRTSHWTGTAWENAGWECRDKVFHCFGSGFPKSLDVSKQLDRMAGIEREVVGFLPKSYPDNPLSGGAIGGRSDGMFGRKMECNTPITAPATPEAKQWEGWGTALKPAVEEWWLLRKPLAENTVAANILEHGTGALNIDGCRVGTEVLPEAKAGQSTIGTFERHDMVTPERIGRFPANLIHDGSAEVLECFPETTSGGSGKRAGLVPKGWKCTSKQAVSNNLILPNTGSAARFFYCAKASKRDRDEGLDGFKETISINGNKWTDMDRREDFKPTPRRNHHPTVKPAELMRYLCRLITPPGGTILDPFCGSGSTGKGAILEGFNFIGIEQDAEYVEIARARIAHVSPEIKLNLEPVPVVKATNQPQQLSLFAG